MRAAVPLATPPKKLNMHIPTSTHDPETCTNVHERAHTRTLTAARSAVSLNLEEPQISIYRKMERLGFNDTVKRHTARKMRETLLHT